jgi:hypothetical protein
MLVIRQRKQHKTSSLSSAVNSPLIIDTIKQVKGRFIGKQHTFDSVCITEIAKPDSFGSFRISIAFFTVIVFSGFIVFFIRAFIIGVIAF